MALMSNMRLDRLLALLLAAALTSAACSGNDGETDSQPTTAVTEPATTAESTTSSVPVTTSPEPADQLRDALTTIVAETGVPALGAAVFDSNGVIDMAAVGVRGRGGDVPVTDGDVFHLGSNTKAMTALLLVRLNEAGVDLSFDTTLADAFPDTGDIDTGYRGVTLGQLLTHTGGSPTEEESGLDESIFELPITEARSKVAEAVISAPPVVASDTVSHYSNPGYVIVGAAMEGATGEGWEDLMIDHVFAPLGMESCGFGAPGTEGAIDQPLGHDSAGTPIYWDLPPLLGPAGTVHCTMADWGVLLVELLNGYHGRSDFVSPAGFDRLFTPVSAPVENFPGARSAPGWLVLEGAQGIGYLHDGSNTAWYSQALIAPEADRAILAVTNEERTGQLAAGLAFEALFELYPT